MKHYSKKHILTWTVNTLLFLSLTACNSLPSSHPASFGSSARPAMLNISTQSNPKITLLLPLRGKYAGPAQAIRNGFLAAHDFDKKQRQIESQVNILDTFGRSAADVYQQAVSEGAQIVVGPLTKEEIQLIAQLPQHPVPTLALNTLDTPNPSRVYQFGLSPTDETHAVAQKAYRSGYRNAIILVPSTAWGRVAENSLRQQWTAMGGRVIDQLAFSTSMQQLSDEMPRLLRVTDHKGPKGTTGPRPSHRQDFDVILLAAPTQHAKEILALLKFNYVQNIPVYATSSAYSGYPNASLDQDLNGLYFCDIPWSNSAQLPESIQAIQQHAAALWPQSYQQYPRFYALGVDAYRLISNTPGAQYGGTGYLTLDRENKLHRRLDWFQIRDGVPVAISD